MRLLALGIHPVGLTAQRLEEALDQEGVDDHEHDGVGDGDREGGASRGEGHEDTGREGEEQQAEDNKLGVHFIH